MAPTILYGVESWGLDHLDKIDNAQADYFKKVLQLPRNTPGYMIRLETRVTRLSVTALVQTWKWIKRILEMDSNRWPRICLLTLINVANNPNCQVKYNWVAKFNTIRKTADMPEMFGNLNPEYWQRYQETFTKAITEQSRRQDFESYLQSTALQLQLIWSKSADTPRYLKIRSPVYLARTIAQLRLANFYNCRIICSE